MSDWLKTLLGVKDSDIPPDAVTSFEFSNLPRGSVGLLMLLLGLALLAGVFWVYRREGSASRRVKIGLGVLRALVLVCAFVVVLEPVLAIDQIEHVDKSTLVIVDASLSMTTRDRYRDPVAREELRAATDADPRALLRYQLVNEMMHKIGFAAVLAKQNQVILYHFSEGIAAPITIPRREEGQVAPPFLPLDLRDPDTRQRGAKGTNIAGAVRQAVEAVGSDRVAAIILISDGRNNLGPPPADLALYLRNKDLRLHTVVVGEAKPPRNLRAVALAGPDRIFRNDPVVFEGRVSGRGYGGTTVDFDRRYTDGSDDWERVGAEVVAFPGGDKPVMVKFTDRPPRVGTVEYRISMVKEGDESNPNDNEKIFVTHVVEEKAKVLLVSGAPAHDYYAIKNVLLRDGTVTLACFLQSASADFPQDGNIAIPELPKNEKELFEFDVLILHDPNGDAMPTDWPALLKKFVAEHGGGLCFIAGNKNTLTLLRSTSGENDITGVLPVVLDLDRADMPGIGIGYGAYFSSPWRMVPEAAALTHPATRFHSDPQRARDLVWDRLPPFFWFFPVLKGKPGAIVLARHEDPRETVEPYGRRPVLAVHRYGAGRVMFVAADETHRWRSVAEPVFDRFWVQTTRFLMEGRHAGGRRRFRIYLDRELVDLGDAVRITAEVFNRSFEPSGKEKVAVEVKGAGLEEEVFLLPVEGKEGHYAGSFAPPAIGDFELRPADKEYRPEKGPDTAAATFRAEMPHREMGDVRADKGLMRELAGRTKGLALGLHQLLRLTNPKLIPPATEEVVTQGRPIPLWDTWTTIIVMLVLLCAEWILRKKYRMV